MTIFEEEPTDEEEYDESSLEIEKQRNNHCHSLYSEAENSFFLV